MKTLIERRNLGNNKALSSYMKEENKVPLLAIAILVIFLLLCVACTKTNKSFILDPSITYPEERNVLMAVPVIPVEIDTIK